MLGFPLKFWVSLLGFSLLFMLLMVTGIIIITPSTYGTADTPVDPVGSVTGMQRPDWFNLLRLVESSGQYDPGEAGTWVDWGFEPPPGWEWEGEQDGGTKDFDVPPASDWWDPCLNPPP